MLKDIFFPQPYLQPFPDPQTVFAEPVRRYGKHLHPLVSIDLSIVDPNLTGKIHMVNPMEPCDGCIGQDAQDYYSDYLKHNWLGFKLNHNGRYELCGDFRYFEVERLETSNADQNELLEVYDRENKVFAAVKANFRDRRELNPFYRDLTPNTNIKFPALRQIGGGVTSGALSYGVGINLDETCPDDVVPLTPDGQRFRFIASTPSWNYGFSSGGVIFLFFEPRSRIALFTFHYD